MPRENKISLSQWGVQVKVAINIIFGGQNFGICKLPFDEFISPLMKGMHAWV